MSLIVYKDFMKLCISRPTNQTRRILLILQLFVLQPEPLPPLLLPAPEDSILAYPLFLVADEGLSGRPDMVSADYYFTFHSDLNRNLLMKLFC